MMEKKLFRRKKILFCLVSIFAAFLFFSCSLKKDTPPASGVISQNDSVLSDIETSESAAKEINQKSGEKLESLLKQKEREYRLGVGDKIIVSVWQHPDLGTEGIAAGRGGVPVEENGTIFLPLVGTLKAQGLTLGELREEISDAYEKYVKNPQVIVSVPEYSSKHFYILGEVRNAGEYQIKYPLSLRQVLSMAGGISAVADLEKAYVIRNDNILPVNFKRLIEEGAANMDIEIINDDFIFIPRKGEENVYVIGEVKSPGMVKMIEGKMNLLSAIASRGDFTIFAVKENIKILRGPLSNPEVITADLGNLTDEAEEGKVSNPELQPGDIVFIPDTSIGRLDKILQKIAPVLRTINEGLQPFYIYDLIRNR